MAHKAVKAAVKARLDALWIKDECPVVGLNADGESPPSTPYLMVQYPVSNTRRMSLGTRQYREEGGIRFVLHLPRGEGTDRADDWADQLTTLFRDQKFDGVETQVPTSPFEDDENDVGSYFVTTVVVPYAFNFKD